MFLSEITKCKTTRFKSTITSILKYIVLSLEDKPYSLWSLTLKSAPSDRKTILNYLMREIGPKYDRGRLKVYIAIYREYYCYYC